MKHLSPLLLLLNFLLVSSYSSFAQTYNPDNTFEPLLVKRYTAAIGHLIVQPDKKILISGFMDYVNNVPSQRLMRLEVDGKIDNSFRLAKQVPSIELMALQANGKILVGGFNASPKERILEFYLLSASGEIDSKHTTSISQGYLEKNAFAVQRDGKLLVGINNYGNGPSAGQILRLHADGSIDPTFSTSWLNLQYSYGFALQPDGKILLIGTMQDPRFPPGFTTSILRLNADGSWDSSFSYMTRNQLFAISLQEDGKILLGQNGYFEEKGRGIIRLHPDGSLDNTFKAPILNTSYNVHSIIVAPQGKIILDIWQAESDRAGYGRGQVARLEVDGSLDVSFTQGAGAEYAISTLALQEDGKVLAAGSFNTFNGAVHTALVRLQASNGNIDDTFRFKTEMKGQILSLVTQLDGKIIVGGRISTSNDQSTSYIARLLANGQVDQAFNTGTGVDEYYGSTSGSVEALAVQGDNKVWAGGFFTSFNGSKTSSLIRLKADGSTDLTFAISTLSHYRVHDIVLQPDSKVLVAGSFSFDKDAAKHLVRFNSDGSLDPSFNSNLPGGVNKVLVGQDNKILVLMHVAIGFHSTSRRVLRLNADGSIDPAFSPFETEKFITAIALQKDGGVIVSGSFRVAGLDIADKIIRLKPDGTLDNGFKTPMQEKDIVRHIVSQGDDKLLLSGMFPSLDRKMVRLQANGLLDTSYAVNTSEPINFTDRVLPDGEKLLLVYDACNLIRLSKPKPLSTAKLAHTALRLYPNPAAKDFMIEIPLGIEVEAMHLADVSGKQVPISWHKTKEGYQLQTQAIQPGLYVVQVYTSKGGFTKRVVFR